MGELIESWIPVGVGLAIACLVALVLWKRIVFSNTSAHLITPTPIPSPQGGGEERNIQR